MIKYKMSHKLEGSFIKNAMSISISYSMHRTEQGRLSEVQNHNLNDEPLPPVHSFKFVVSACVGSCIFHSVSAFLSSIYNQKSIKGSSSRGRSPPPAATMLKSFSGETCHDIQHGIGI